MPTWRTFAISCVALLSIGFGAVCLGQEQYKRISRDAVAQIVDGNHDDAIGTCQEYLQAHPDDIESLYVLAVAHTQKGQIEEALFYAKKAIAAGLPFERFQAGPRELLQPLTKSDKFKALAQEYGREILHGPMISVTDRQARCWLRTAGATQVGWRLYAVGQGNGPTTFRKAGLGETNSKNDFTAVLSLTGLKPATLYEYRLGTSGDDAESVARFRTSPERGKPATFAIGFGGGAGYTPPHERMWDTVRSRNLTAFLFLGDNVYIDNPTRQAVQRYCYYRRQSRPEFRKFVAGTPIYAIWDDHDFTTDDGWGGPDIHEPAWKLPVWRTFQNNWANPYYGGGPTQPGCWFDFSLADVDFFMLDGRYYRVEGRRQGLEVENPSMLGQAQKRWLFEKLGESKATFKVLVSPVPWASGAKPGKAGMDTWEGFHEEREEIFSFLARHRIEGVLLLSADRHRSDAWKIERENGYPLYEFESSRLTNIHKHGIMPGSLFGYNKTCSFGLLAFDTTLVDPEVTYKVVTIDNEVVHTLTVRKSQLTHAENAGN
ncbi:MAG: alkaline phosphatase D family protein [Phycisphaerales bacterium]|nr:MAG: alkaline phosphatase D family protein [Phycisphaerales bacterium]